MLRLLHTADWHLGCRYEQLERDTEHRLLFDVLRGIIINHNIDALIIAGDVFDSFAPPSSARRLYYEFLASLYDTPCRNIVVVGGNHDSAALLNADSPLLEHLHIFVVGGATERIEDEIIILRDANGKPEAIVAAVPFLQHADVRTSVAAQADEERTEQVRKGIADHYAHLATAIATMIDTDPLMFGALPVIATGHLHAIGAEVGDDIERKSIYYGDDKNIDANTFPLLFDYVALGHIHRAQTVGRDSVRYSGSLLPVSVSETKSGAMKKGKAVIEVVFEGKSPTHINEIYLPEVRKLRSYEGTLEEIKRKLTAHTPAQPLPSGEVLPSWITVKVRTHEAILDLTKQLNEHIQDHHLAQKLLIVKQSNLLIDEMGNAVGNASSFATNTHQNLSELSPVEVFEALCEHNNISDAIRTQIKPLFESLIQ